MPVTTNTTQNSSQHTTHPSTTIVPAAPSAPPVEPDVPPNPPAYNDVVGECIITPILAVDGIQPPSYDSIPSNQTTDHGKSPDVA